jgi:hypothetical protein
MPAELFKTKMISLGTNFLILWLFQGSSYSLLSVYFMYNSTAHYRLLIKCGIHLQCHFENKTVMQQIIQTISSLLGLLFNVHLRCQYIQHCIMRLAETSRGEYISDNVQHNQTATTHEHHEHQSKVHQPFD